MKQYLVAFILLLTAITAGAQKTAEDHLGLWTAWINGLTLHPGWRIDTDVHLRTFRFPDDPNILILRGGLMHAPLPWLELTAGYGYFEFYTFGTAMDAWKAHTTEHRPWEQVLVKHKNYGFNFNHRLRLENRIVNAADDFFQNRFRLRSYVQRPFSKTFYGWASYEHFWTLGDWKFDQGRLHAGLGCAVNPHLKVEAAYLRHFVKGKLHFNRLQINVITAFKMQTRP